MTDHVFHDVDGDVVLAVVDAEAKSNHPGVITESRDQVFDDCFVANLQLLNLSQEFRINERCFLAGTSHKVCGYFCRRLTIKRFEYFFWRRVRTPSACFPHGVFGYFIPIGWYFAAAVRVVDRVHGFTANGWPAILPAHATSFPPANISVIVVGHLPDRGHAGF